MDLSNYPDSCKYCKFSVYSKSLRKTFCRYRGIAEISDICKRYSFDPFKYKVRRIRALKIDKFTQSDFDIE